MIITLRDLTVAHSFADVCADISGDAMTINIHPDHEYIVVDSDGTLKPDELTNLADIRLVLEKAKENGYNDDALAILSQTFLFNEIKEMAEENFESLIIINFDAETSTWSNGTGAYADDNNLGLVLYEQGYNSFGCEIPEVLMDAIRWEQNWNSAECDGYRYVNYKNNGYIVRR